MARDTVAEIKDRLSIKDVVAPYVKLTKAGRSWKGVCPFHKEKTPSFMVSPERGSWHCFGCGEGGDAFSFIERIEGVDFKGALKVLAEKAGVTLEYTRGRQKDTSKIERLRTLMNRAAEWYAGKLPGSSAEAYAKKRALTKETIAAWRLGFAPNDWRNFLEAFTAEGFSTQELLAAGLVKEADGKPGTYYDRFRNRLMFPISDPAGRVVAFTGRALAADEQAKYLNSPETELYHKSDILFGMCEAKDAIRARKFTLLVEGQMDVLMAHQAGFANAVALSGTALTEKHLALMKRFSDNLMLVLDADAAGLTATARSAILALRHGLRVKAARLPKGKDPADLITEDQKEFAKRVSEAKPIADFFLAELVERHTDPHRLLRAVEEVVLPLVAAIESPMERDHFVENTARATGLSKEAVRESLAKIPKMLNVQETISVTDTVTNTQRSARDIRKEQLRAVIGAYPETPLAKRVRTEYSRITGAEVPVEPLPEAALFATEQMFGEEPQTDAADELLHAFEEAVVREAYQAKVMELRRAEAAGNAADVARAEKECADLSARIAGLGP